jgi:hypothetical protein
MKANAFPTFWPKSVAAVPLLLDEQEGSTAAALEAIISRNISFKHFQSTEDLV